MRKIIKKRSFASCSYLIKNHSRSQFFIFLLFNNTIINRLKNVHERFWRDRNAIYEHFPCTNTHAGNDTLSHLVRRHRPDVFHCQSQGVHKFLSQHDDGVIVIATGDSRRAPTVSGASCKRASSFNFRVAASFGEGEPSFSYWRDREFSRVFATYPAYDLVFISVARVVDFRRVASPESRGCLTSFHEKLVNTCVLSSGL